MQSASLPLYLGQRFNSLVWSCIDSQLTRTALFYAELYYYIDTQNHDARHLYATALLREQQTHSALHIVTTPNPCAACSEIKAQCLFTLGRNRQARDALDAALRDANHIPTGSLGPRTSQSWPDAAALHCRAGTASLKGRQTERAFDSFKRALSLNPFLFEAYEGICNSSSTSNVDSFLPPRAGSSKEQKHEPGLMPTGAGFFTPDAGTSNNLFAPRAGFPQPFRINPLSGPRDSIGTTASSFYLDTPLHRNTRSQLSPVVNPAQARPLSSAEEAGPVTKKPRWQAESAKPPSKNVEAPTKKARARKALSYSNNLTSGPQPPSRIAKAPITTPANPTTGTRRSKRLTAKQPAKKNPAQRERPKQPVKARPRSEESEEEEFPAIQSPSTSSIHSPRSEGSSGHNGILQSQEIGTQESAEIALADKYIYEIMRQFAKATQHLAQFECQQCIDELSSLPSAHQKSPWVLSMVGRAHFELLDYPSAERAFLALRKQDPYRIWDMEVYSTLLWHLQKSVDLSFLAQELVSINPHSSQAWIAVGNLFSLQKERPQALTCFERAYDLDSTCAYAYTLSGHECIDEDLNKAIVHFENALKADPRHYNAWYGLGTCYLRQSKFTYAEYHYQRALVIHPKNAVLLGCVGMTLEKRGQQGKALEYFNRAVELTPNNALVRYRRAKLLIAAKRYRDAIHDLETLQSHSPEEANVIFQLAKVYRLVGNETKSAQLLAAARDISPKSIEKIKKIVGDGKR